MANINVEFQEVIDRCLSTTRLKKKWTNCGVVSFGNNLKIFLNSNQITVGEGTAYLGNYTFEVAQDESGPLQLILPDTPDTMVYRVVIRKQIGAPDGDAILYLKEGSSAYAPILDRRTEDNI